MNLPRWLVVAMLSACATNAQGQSAQGPEYQSYLAHISAANASLRLHETAEAKKWLAAAPSEYRGWEWHMLTRRADQSVSSLAPEGLSARRFHLRPDGNLLAAVIDDTLIDLIDTRTRQLVRRIQGHSRAVYGVRFSPDGARLVSCSRATTIRVWDAATGRQLWSGHSRGWGFSDVDFSPDGRQILFSSWFRPAQSVAGIVSLWNAATGQREWETEFGDKPIVVARFSPDGSRFAVGTWGWRVAAWSRDTLGSPIIFHFDDVVAYSAIDDIAFSPDGSKIAAATKNGTPRVWDLTTGSLLFELRRHTQPVPAVTFSADGAHIVTGGTDGVVMVWDGHTGRFLTKLYGHTGQIAAFSTPARGTTLASLSSDRSIRFWDLSGREHLSILLAGRGGSTHSGSRRMGGSSRPAG